MEPIISTAITIAIIVLILGAAAFYVIRAKKKGQKCIGCPDARTCPHAKNGCCGCESIEK